MSHSAGMLTILGHWLCLITWGDILILLKRNDPALGYYPKPNKIILKGHPNNIKVGELFCTHCVFRCTWEYAFLAVIYQG